MFLTHCPAPYYLFAVLLIVTYTLAKYNEIMECVMSTEWITNSCGPVIRLESVQIVTVVTLTPRTTLGHCVDISWSLTAFVASSKQHYL